MKLLAAVTALLALVAIVATHDIEKRQARRLRARPQGIAKRRNSGQQGAQVSDPTPPGKRVVCYYTNWSVYRKGLAKFEPSNINPYLCTHLIYAFGGFTDDFEMTTFDSYQDIDKGGYAQFNALKKYNPSMRTLLAVGGWNEGSARFSEMVGYAGYRETFVNSTLKHLRRYNFDGLDLDWEYPASRPGALPEDRENYALLVKELRAAFEAEAARTHKPRLLLTMAVPAGQDYIDRGYDIPSLNRDLDFFNILNYDYHVSVDPVVRHHAALLPLPGTSEHDETYKLNVDWTVKYYVLLGADKLKLVVGIPTYGRSFKLVDPAFSDFESPANGAGTAGNSTREDGFLAFYEVCEAMAVDNWQAKKPYPRSMGPYAYKDDQWVGYDDEVMAATKAEYVRDTGLGGIMFWSLDTDDFRGVCNGQRYLLVESAKAALLRDPAVNINAVEQRRKGVTQAPVSTPEPPTTPSTVPDFVCVREGFHPNPDDCHKYFWCLDTGSAGNGIVPHAFTCPSDLVFSRKIGGCEHPDRAKCNVKKNRGGADEPTEDKRPAFPTTTPFPAFDYDYYYYDEEEGDYLDSVVPSLGGPEGPSVALQEAAVQPELPASTTARTSTRNSGGSQFSRTAAEEAAADIRSSSKNNNNERSRPQYTSISRDRPAATREEPAPVEESSAPGGSNARRPQYTSIQRNRPSTEAPPDYDDLGVTPGSRLNYVTIERRRPQQSEDDLLETATQSSGLQYVTLSRAGSRGTTPATAAEAEDGALGDTRGLVSVDSDSFRLQRVREETTEEITTTTTTTTTTTPRPARVVVPQVLLEPVTQSVYHRLNLDPRKSDRPLRERSRQRQEVSEVTERTRRPSARRTTTETAAPVYPDELSPAVEGKSAVDYVYEDEYLDELLPGSAAEPSVDESTAAPSPSAPAVEVTEEEALGQPDGADNIINENNVVVEVDAETPLREDNINSASEATTLRTTVNLLADFPAFATAAPTAEDAAVSAVDADTLPAAGADADAAVAADDVVENVVEAKTLEDASVADAPATEATTEEIPAPLAPDAPASAPDTEEAAPVSERRTPRLPPRPTRTESSPSGGQQSDGRRPQLPGRRPPSSSRFTPTRSGSANEAVGEGETRRNRFRPSSQRSPTTEDRPSTGTQSRFRPRPTPVQNSEAQTDRETTPERTRNRFQNRPTSENRFRLNPVAVTTAPPPTRPRRPRPVSDRSRPQRPNLAIRFRAREETTESSVPEATIPVLIPSEEEEVAEAEQAVTSTVNFSDIFGSNPDTASSTAQPVEHRILETERPEEEQAAILEPEVVPRTESSLRFEDLFPQTTAPSVDLIEEVGPTSPPRRLEEVVPTTPPSRQEKADSKLEEAESTSPPARITTEATTTTTSTAAPVSRASSRRTSLRTSIAPTTSPRPVIRSKVSRTPPPLPVTVSQTPAPRPSVPRGGGRPPPGSRTTTWRPPTQLSDYVYDYFYDDDTGALGGTLGELAELSEKALLLPGGKVKCYDTGYFAHPDSCKKFISCSKTVRGAVRGWVYTCPQQLVFDPVGGMCNWAETVDCQAPIE